jgi:hypothetical protein
MWFRRRLPLRAAAVFFAALALPTALLVMPANTALAQGELAVRWSACGSDGFIDFVQNCTSNFTERRIVFSFTPEDSIMQATGWSIVFDVASDADTLPPWWQTQPGGCRPGQFVSEMPSGFEGNCTDVWSAAGSGLVQSIIYPRDNDPRKLRVILGIAVPAVSSFTLEASVPYLGAVLGLRFAGTTSGTCPGCSAPVCMVFNSVEITRAPGAQGPAPTPLVTPSPAYGNMITSGGGTACAIVPVVNRTWGGIKALYR